MIKMTRVYGDMYVPREYCTFTNPVTSGGTEEVDYVDMPCENGCEKECENCTLQKIMNEYARLTRQDIDEKKRHCEECENYKEIRKGPRGGKKGICRILRPSEVRNGRARACKRFQEQNEQTASKETIQKNPRSQSPKNSGSSVHARGNRVNEDIQQPHTRGY